MRKGMSLLLRRCHVCDSVSEILVSEKEKVPLEKCRYCGKSWAPFFYFEEGSMAVFQDNLERPVDPHPWPLRGLSVIWDDPVEGGVLSKVWRRST